MSNANISSHKIGATFTAIVRDLASDGRGIVAHPDGLTVFVPGIWIGEECLIRLIGLQNRIGLGELVELIEPSSARIQPPCPHHGNKPGECGGCPWQFIDYQQQLNAKQQRVANAFARLDFHHVESIWPSPNTLAYRNRAQLKTDGIAIGYVSANSHVLAPINSCTVLSEHNQQTLADLLLRLPNNNWRPKKASSKRGRHKLKAEWTSLNIDDRLNADQVVINKRLPFQQSHDSQNLRMQEWLGKTLRELDVNGPVLELFSGAGNFTEVIASTVKTEIVAIEGDEGAVAILEQKKLPRVQALRFDLFDESCFELIYNRRRDFTVLVLDPPRDGLKNTKHLLSKKTTLTTVLYISCNLATLCRDLEFFIANGFAIKAVQALDQSPHTPHIEILVHLQKK